MPRASVVWLVLLVGEVVKVFLRHVKSWMNVLNAVAARQRPREFLGHNVQVRKLLQAASRVPVLVRKVSRVEGTQEADGGERRIRESARVVRQAQGGGETVEFQRLGFASSEIG